LVPPDNEGSNYGQASADLLSHIPILPANIHRARGELEALAAVETYSANLRHFAVHTHHTRDAIIPWPCFDLVLLGLGSDGHTASLFPGAATGDWETIPVVAATAEYQGRPAGRLTLTPLVINDARYVLFLVTGKDKAAAVAATLQGDIDPESWPAQCIRPRAGQLTWLLDADAAAGL
jgi:6-phosphogluconolactonase